MFQNKFLPVRGEERQNENEGSQKLLEESLTGAAESSGGKARVTAAWSTERMMLLTECSRSLACEQSLIKAPMSTTAAWQCTDFVQGTEK